MDFFFFFFFEGYTISHLFSLFTPVFVTLKNWCNWSSLGSNNKCSKCYSRSPFLHKPVSLYNPRALSETTSKLCCIMKTIYIRYEIQNKTGGIQIQADRSSINQSKHYKSAVIRDTTLTVCLDLLIYSKRH